MSRSREKGQGLMEYALILALVAIVIIVVLAVFGGTLNEFFSEVNSAFPE